MINNIIEFRKELEKINEWWFTGRVKEAEVFQYKREDFLKIKEELKSRRIIILLGPRRVGKSVLLKQVIDDLIKSKINPRKIAYYSLDDPTLSTYSDNLIKDLIDYFIENISKEEKSYIFLDEIHTFSDWFKWIKSYYDKYRHIHFILSGSSSLALQKEANKYLRGRTVEIELYPLDFKEFLKFSGADVNEFSKIKMNNIDDFNIRKIWHNIKQIYSEYLLVGGFPEWFEVKKLDNPVEKWFQRLIYDIPKKAIYEDVVNFYGIKNPKILEIIFAFIAANQSRILSYESINDIAKLDRATLINYIEFLKASYLVIEVLKFAKIKEQIKSKKKFLLVDQGIRNAILKDYEIKEDNIGFIIENVIGVKIFLKYKKLFYYKYNDEVDFVIADEEIIPVEVKYRNQIGERDIKSMLNFMEKGKLNKGIVVTKDLFKKEKIRNKQIIFLPAWSYLLIEDV